MWDGDAPAPKPEKPKPERPRGKPPSAIATELLGDGDRFLTDHSDTVYQYAETHWKPLSETTLRQIVMLADTFKRSTSGRRREIIDQIKARSHIPDLKWGRVADWEVACANGVVDVRNGEIRPHRFDDYLEKIVPHPYMPGAKAAAFEAALRQWWPHEDGGEVAALQEFFGYVALSHAKYKKALLLLGKSNTGKTVITYLLELLVGADQVCALPVDQMDDPQARAVIVGKSLNIMTELSVDAMIADGGFKQLVGTEEPVYINQKFKPGYTYLSTAKHVFAANSLPRMTDRTEAILGRLLLIPMRRVFGERDRDDGLRARLAREMPGILSWAIAGAKRLVEAGGRFSPIAGAASAIEEMRTEANPALDFIRECLTADERCRLPLQSLVDEFNRWNKGSRKASTKGLGKMLRAAGQIVKDVRHGRAVVKALAGYKVIPETERAPRWFHVDDDADAGDPLPPTSFLPEDELS